MTWNNFLDDLLPNFTFFGIYAFCYERRKSCAVPLFMKFDPHQYVKLFFTNQIWLENQWTYIGMICKSHDIQRITIEICTHSNDILHSLYI